MDWTEATQASLVWAGRRLIAFGAVGALVPKLPTRHLLVRLWDFPRVQFAVAAGPGLAEIVVVALLTRWTGAHLAWTGLAPAALASHAHRITPYTRRKEAAERPEHAPR